MRVDRVALEKESRYPSAIAGYTRTAARMGTQGAPSVTNRSCSTSSCPALASRERSRLYGDPAGLHCLRRGTPASSFVRRSRSRGSSRAHRCRRAVRRNVAVSHCPAGDMLSRTNNVRGSLIKVVGCEVMSTGGERYAHEPALTTPTAHRDRVPPPTCRQARRSALCQVLR